MSTSEITMDGPENPEPQPGRRLDLSALAWRRSDGPPAPDAGNGAAPSNGAAEAGPNGTAGNGTAGNGTAVPGTDADDTWSPPEPWSPPAWSPPEWPPAAAQPVDEVAEADVVGADVVEAEIVDEASSPGEPGPTTVDADVVDDAAATALGRPTTEYPFVYPAQAWSEGAAADETTVDGDAAAQPANPFEPVTPFEPVAEAGPAAQPATAEWASTVDDAWQAVDQAAPVDEVPPAQDRAPAFEPAPAFEQAPTFEQAPAFEPTPPRGFATPVVEQPPFEETPAPAAMFEPPTAPVEPPAPVAPAPAPAAYDDLPPIDAILPQADGYKEVGFDTVARAVATSGEFQPYLELGLQPDEYAKIRQVLGRRPTESELAMYSVMWSEHCSYKSSKVHLRQFGEKAPPSDRLLAGIGAQAGVIRVSDTLAVTFKVESHNHPSFVEPHQGAATGVGGIVRDILAMGARPIAVMDPLRFGAPDHEDTKRVLPGVVGGIGGYGNCLGLPNIGGEVVFDECYQGNPLVNALCLGVLPVNKLQHNAATGPGNVVVLIGAKTGRDGIGGASVLASSTFGQGSENRRPSVQVGDPFVEKLLIEACLEIYDLNLVTAIQDLGAAGLSCGLAEMSAAAGLGMAVNLDLVPLREASMRAEEVLASESQERMLLVVTPENLPVVLSICARWGVLATAIGEVTPAESEAGGRLRIWWRGEVVVDVPPGSLADDGPVYARPMREPFDRELMKVDRAETLPRPETPEQLRETVLRMIGSPNLCDKSWVTEQYDRYVLGNTVLAQPEDSGVIRIDERTGLGVALATDGNGRYARLDPYQGAKLALAEAYRNVAVTGAVPVAVTNCLNFGSPEDPGVMWQFAEAVRGLADGCAELGIPVTGGNVSFYNQTGGTPINPTPVVGVLGVMDNVARRVPMGFSGLGDAIFLLGETKEELGGSEWAHVTHRHLGGAPPSVDLGAEQRLAALLAEASLLGYLTAAHDISDGGLVQALVESCLRRDLGAHVALPPDGQSAFVHLFSESTARAVVTVRKGQEQAFAALAEQRGVPRVALGVVEGTSLNIDGVMEIGLDEVRQAHTGTLPAIFG